MTAASKDEISKWFDEGLAQGATHMIIVCDTFSHDDYPVYVNVNQGEDVRAEAATYDGPEMQKVMEVYCLSMSKKAQLEEWRAFHYDMPAERVN